MESTRSSRTPGTDSPSIPKIFFLHFSYFLCSVAVPSKSIFETTNGFPNPFRIVHLSLGFNFIHLLCLVVPYDAFSSLDNAPPGLLATQSGRDTPRHAGSCWRQICGLFIGLLIRNGRSCSNYSVTELHVVLEAARSPTAVNAVSGMTCSEDMPRRPVKMAGLDPQNWVPRSW